MDLASLAQVQKQAPAKASYHGPTLFEGQQIPMECSPNILADQILRQLDRSGFCSINIIGIPGSGKSVCANMIGHLIHTRRPEFVILWLGSNELRHIKEYLASLKKGLAYFLIFDDTSNALDSLSGEELSEAFQSFTRARHEIQGRICSVMIHHYTKSAKKNFRSQAIFNIYLSSTSTEKGNVKELIRGDQRAVSKFKQFQRLFRTSFSEDYFELDLGNGMTNKYDDSNPFRICYVLGPLGANLMLTVERKCQLCSEKPLLPYLEPEEILTLGQRTSYKDYHLMALSMICWHKGEKDALPNDLRKTMDFFNRVLGEANTDFHELCKLVKKARRTRQKRYYRPRKEEDEAYSEAMKKVTRKPMDFRPLEIRVLEGLDSLFPS